MYVIALGSGFAYLTVGPFADERGAEEFITAWGLISASSVKVMGIDDFIAEATREVRGNEDGCGEAQGSRVGIEEGSAICGGSGRA